MLLVLGLVLSNYEIAHLREIPWIGKFLIRSVGKPDYLPTVLVLGLFGSAGDVDEVVAKLGLDGSVDFVEVGAEDDLVEFLDHLTRGELAKIATLLA